MTPTVRMQKPERLSPMAMPACGFFPWARQPARETANSRRIRLTFMATREGKAVTTVHIRTTVRIPNSLPSNFKIALLCALGELRSLISETLSLMKLALIDLISRHVV